MQSRPAGLFSTFEPRASSAEIDTSDYARFYRFPSILDFGFDLRSGSARLVFRVDIRPDFLSFATSAYRTNLPAFEHGLDSVADVNMPTVSFFEYEGRKLSLSLGRRAISLGPGQYGLALSGSIPAIDHLVAQYEFPTRRGGFWYEFIAIGADRFGDAFSFGPPAGDVPQNKNIFIHRLGWEGEHLRIAASELNLVHDIVPALIDISPFAVYHNLYQDAYSNVMLDASAELYYAPFRAYGEFAMDDLVMPWENPGARPSAMGFLAGAQWKIAGGQAYGFGEMDEADYLREDRSFRVKGGLDLSLEFYRTTGYIYGRENASGRWTLPDHRLVSAAPFYLNEESAFCLGFPYGPDTSLALASLAWESSTSRARIDLGLLRKGARGIDSWDTTNAATDWFALAEPVKTNLILRFAGELALKSWIGLWARLEALVGDTPEVNLGAGLSLRFSTR
ncbi:MAG TPA: hypothetical protein VIO60_04195 [Rectinemataceae bacterium]